MFVVLSHATDIARSDSGAVLIDPTLAESDMVIARRSRGTIILQEDQTRIGTQLRNPFPLRIASVDKDLARRSELDTAAVGIEVKRAPLSLRRDDMHTTLASSSAEHPEVALVVVHSAIGTGIGIRVISSGR